jgi:hypothetical protein
MQIDAKPAMLKLLAYCRANAWAGYDPYDALNSKLFTNFSFLQSRLPRLVLTQTLKRSPINLRGLLAVPKTQNPKALALFLASLLKMSDADVPDRKNLIQFLIDRLQTLRSAGSAYWCWGYSFAWQTRTEVVPAGYPNLVCTTFVANALLDVYDQMGDTRCLSMAKSAAEYILNELYWTEGSLVGFSYPTPTMRNQVHNANLLAAALLCRIYKRTGEDKFFAPALQVARFSAGMQQPDGSWFYGEAASQKWIDNFHTGYNLSGLRSLDREMETTEFAGCVQRGFEFYRAHFFREDGAARYFHNRTYPIDIHCVAQSIITLLEFRDLDAGSEALAHSVYEWAMKHMWDEQGFFYYRVLRSCTIRTSYMRWSQAWMLLALSTLTHDSRMEVKSHSGLGVASLAS